MSNSNGPSDAQPPTGLEIVDWMGEIVVVRDADAHITYVNAAFCETFGEAPAAWIGRAFCLGGGELTSGAADGRRVRYEATAETVRGPGWFEWEETRLATGARLAIGRDVTRRKKSEDALRDARKDAEAANRAKTQFLATMSHEMRTPLNGILGMTGLLLDTPLTANQKTYADAVRDSGAGLLALINDILDFSKIEAGRLDLEEGAFDLTAAVQSVVELLSPRAAEKGVEIAAYIDPRTPVQLRGDEARLRQVLFNLAGNGVKFTETGGVAISVGLDGDGGEAPDLAALRIDVRDTGVGVPEDAREQIFDEFAQADSSHSRRFGGTGLGLAIVKRIVAAMGGRIWLDSTPGAGSTFSFTFRLPVIAKPAPAPAVGEGRRAVIATRSPILADIVARQTAALGFAPQPHADPAAAEAALAAETGAILLCDAEIAARAGASLAAAADRALVLLPASARGQADAYRAAGFDGYLLKPVRQASLRERLAGAASGAPAPSPAADDERLDAPRPAPAEPGRRLRILLAEDNQINAVLATALLKRAGHHVDVAATGEEALDAVTIAPYDVILMDMHMPEMDGVEATKRIRALDGAEAAIPIIALTANAMAETRQQCLRAGMDDFITKPFDPNDLAAAIDRWSRGRQAEAS